MIRAVIASLAIALAIAPLGLAHAETAQTKKVAPTKTYKLTRSAQPRIACTAFGCQTIPANCSPETGYSWDGTPTGFDVIMCR